ALLFQYLKKQHPYYDEKKMDPAVMEKKAPALGNQKKQANAGSELLKAVEGFLAIEDFWITGNINVHKLKAYKNHHLFDAFNKEHDHLLNEINKQFEQGIESFYERHLLTELGLNGFDVKLNRTIANDVLPVIKTLDEFYALKKLRYHCEFLNRHQVLGTPYHEDNIAYVLEVLEPFNNSTYPYAHLFLNVYKMLKTGSFEEGEKYYKTVQNFIEGAETLSVNLREVINYLVNYCLFWNSRGYKEAGAVALWGLEMRMRYDEILEHGKIAPSDFRNIVVLAILNAKDPAWIKQFIDGYAQYLPLEQADTNKAFAEAQYFYYTKDFAKAMALFQQAQVKEEPIFNAIVRRWQFMCMYEENPGNTNVLLDFLDAYEKYLQRNTTQLHAAKEIFIKNIFYGKKLLKATDKLKRTSLVELLNAENYFPGKEWFLHQIK
nr:hypothetical protein [Chitinophagales bacterium]